MFVLASLASWLPFAIVVLLIIVFSIFFTFRYQRKKRRDKTLTIVSTISIAVALLCSSLLPSDVIFVSLMKNSDGTFKDWASNQTDRDEIQKYFQDFYYAFYGIVVLMAFIVNPFFFFYAEERDEGEKLSSRLCSAVKWTSGFLLVLIILIILGIFLPGIVESSSSNTTDVSYWIEHFDSSKFQDSIMFSIFSLSIIGFCLLTIYTGYGSIALPISLIKGKRNLQTQREQLEEERRMVSEKIEDLKSKAKNRRRGLLTTAERDRLSQLETREDVLRRNERSMENLKNDFVFKFRFLFRPAQILLGILTFLLASLIFVSLILSNVDKIIHFNDMKNIFSHGNHTLPNPIDLFLSWAGQVYPISYILLMIFLIYVIFTSIFGLQQIGIWCFCFRMYRFSRGRTKNQALIMFSSFMMFIVLGSNVFFYLLMPSYSVYGYQVYQQISSNGTFTATARCTEYQNSDLCQTTVMGRILLRFFYKVWFFGAAFYSLSWFYIVVFIISFAWKILRKGESNIHMANLEETIEDDLDLPLIR